MGYWMYNSACSLTMSTVELWCSRLSHRCQSKTTTNNMRCGSCVADSRYLNLNYAKCVYSDLICVPKIRNFHSTTNRLLRRSSNMNCTFGPLTHRVATAIGIGAADTTREKKNKFIWMRWWASTGVCVCFPKHFRCLHVSFHTHIAHRRRALSLSLSR